MLTNTAQGAKYFLCMRRTIAVYFLTGRESKKVQFFLSHELFHVV